MANHPEFDQEGWHGLLLAETARNGRAKGMVIAKPPVIGPDCTLAEVP